MLIQNDNVIPEQRVVDWFLSLMPFGSDYVIYYVNDTADSASYNFLFEEPVTHKTHYYQIIVNENQDHTLSEFDLSDLGLQDLRVSDIEMSNPYYCYSSVAELGVPVEVSPSYLPIMTFMLIVICSLLVLKTVFGGIKLWSARK